VVFFLLGLSGFGKRIKKSIIKFAWSNKRHQYQSNFEQKEQRG
jgi:hypothetical protein